MSNVDLGFLEECEDWEVESRLFPSKVGGKPAWLDLENLPKVADLKCDKCNQVMIFLCQVYAPIEDDEDNFHRTLYVFICKNVSCCERNDSGNIKVFRNSLPRKNKFYDFDPPVDEPDDSFSINKYSQFCNLCGILAEKHCSQCKSVAYCDREHQVLDWKEGHKAECKTNNKSNRESKLLFPQKEIVIESESLQKCESNEEKELEKFKKLEDEGKTGTLNDISETELDAHATSDEDKVFSKFKKRVAENPEQILRYERNGTPLWIAAEPVPETLPNCACGASRQFEFQIMPQLLSLLNENELDWGVIAIYTCSKNCNIIEGYKEEFVFKQDVTLSSL